jgi:hypothetical protein
MVSSIYEGVFGIRVAGLFGYMCFWQHGLEYTSVWRSGPQISIEIRRNTHISTILVSGFAVRGVRNWPPRSPDLKPPWLPYVGVWGRSCLWTQSGHKWGPNSSQCLCGCMQQWPRHSSSLYTFRCETGKNVLSKLKVDILNICDSSESPGDVKSGKTIKLHFFATINVSVIFRQS